MAITIGIIVEEVVFWLATYYAEILAVAVYLRANNQSNRAASRARRNLASLAEGGRALMVRQPLTARRTLYGINRMSGPITLLHVSASKHLYILITLSAHPVHAIDDVYLNDEILDIDSVGTVLSTYYGSVVVKKGLGTTAGDADLHAFLIGENLVDKDGNPLWTANHLQAGCAKLLVRLAPNRNVFPSGIPNVSAVVRGKKVYDPRTATTGYSANAALCIRDYLIDPLQLGATASEIDDTGMAAQANICDEAIAGKSQPNTFIRAQLAPPITQAIADYTFEQEGTLLLETAYTYKITFYDASGETPGGIESSSTPPLGQPPGGGSIRLTSIPTGAMGTVGRKIYRDGFLAGSLADNTTTVFIDTGSMTGAAIPVANTTDITDTIVRDKPLPYLIDGDPVVLTTTGTLPAPYALLTTYYYIYINSTTGKLATTKANAVAGIGIVRTTVGSGVHSIARAAETRYTLHGPIDSVDTPKGALEAMLTSCAGKLTNPGGIWTLLAGSWRAPTVTLDENDLDGPIKVVARISKRDLANGVKGTFVDPGNGWQPTDFPPVTNALYKTEDNNERLWQDIELPFTISPSTAQRLAKIHLEQVRQPVTTVWPCKLSALRVQIGDVINLTNVRFGWSAKPFEVVDLKFAVRADGDSPRLGVDLSLRETAAGVYDWNSGEETLVDLEPNTNLPNPAVIAQPSNLAAASGTQHLYLRSDGTVFSRVKLTWTTSTDANVLSDGFFEVEYRKQSSLLVDWEKSATIPGTESSTYVLDVEDSVAYLFRVRAVNNLGVRSTWAALRHVVVGKTALPANVTGFSAAQNGNVVVLRWDQVADVDLSGYEIRYIVQGGTNWDAATPLTRVTRGTQITTAGLPPGNWTLFIKARDTSENYSAAATAYNIDMVNALNVIQTIADEPDWLNVDYLNFNFNDSLDGFTVEPGTCTLTAGESAASIVALTNDPIIRKSVSFSGLTYRYVIARIKRTVGTGWEGNIFYTTAGHGESASFYKAASVPAGIDSGFVDVVWDMHALTVGGTDWKDNIITGIRVDLGNAVGNNFDIDSIHLSELPARTNFVRHWTGFLVPDSQDAAALNTWDTFDIFVPNPLATCVYVANKDIDILFADTIRVWADMAATLGPGATGFPNPKLEVDYHSGAGFDGYEPWTIGAIIARYIKAKLVLLLADGVAYVSKFQTTADVEAHTETGAGVVVGATGTAIVFADRYHFTPSIQITPQGAGLFAGYTSDSGTGFTAHVYNAAGTEVGGTISWTSDGE